jgi:hypothetical protein
MTESEITDKIKQIAGNYNKKNIIDTMKAEDKLFSLYKKQSNKIGNIISGSSIEDVKDINDYLDNTKNILDDKTTSIISKSIDKSIKNGIKSTRSQITVFKDILPDEIVDSDIQQFVFNQVYIDAIIAMEKCEDGLELSQKIWDINQISLDDIRRYMIDSMLNDRDFSDVYQHIKSFLLLPDVDLRTKKWRDFFKENPPGRGRYRSAFKNVMRVLRTETNRAFRLGSVEYAKGKFWVYGIKFELSLAHPEFDICTWRYSEIKTNKDTINIENIKKGMKVLTHKNRYKKVIRTFKRTIQDKELVIVAYHMEKDRTRMLILTPNHPVLTEQGWIQAGNLLNGIVLKSEILNDNGKADQLFHGTLNKEELNFGGNVPFLDNKKDDVVLYDAFVQDVICKYYRYLYNFLTYNFLHLCENGNSEKIYHLSNLDCHSLYALLNILHEVYQAFSTYQVCAFHNLDYFCQYVVHSLLNNKFVLSNNFLKQNVVYKLDKFVVQLNEQLNNIFLNNNCVYLSLKDFLKTVFYILHKQLEVWLISLLQNRNDCKISFFEKEKNLCNYIGFLFHSIDKNYINNSMNYTKGQVIYTERIKIGKIDVYNLEVEKDNSYCANNIFVHNCDEYATQDIDGLGSGIYRPENFPVNPHPHCICYDRLVPNTDFLGITL